jgi:glucose/mannose transport system permease protein
MAIRRISRTVLYVVLAIFSLIYLMPIYVLLTTSFKPQSEVDIAHMWALPHHFSFAGYSEAFSSLAPNLGNSLYLAIGATVISSIVGAFNGYALSKWKFRGANIIFPLILFGMFIPYQSILIPLIKFIQALGLYNSIPGLILTNVIYGLPVTTLIFRNYYAGIPDDLMESAQIDGAAYWGIFFRIMLPLAIPGFVVVGIWQFTSIWNEFLFAVTLTSQPNQPITVALQNLSGSESVQWNVQMAGAVLAALPTLIVYIVLGRYFIRGLLAGSIKG